MAGSNSSQRVIPMLPVSPSAAPPARTAHNRKYSGYHGVDYIRISPTAISQDVRKYRNIRDIHETKLREEAADSTEQLDGRTTYYQNSQTNNDIDQKQVALDKKDAVHAVNQRRATTAQAVAHHSLVVPIQQDEISIETAEQDKFHDIYDPLAHQLYGGSSSHNRSSKNFHAKYGRKLAIRRANLRKRFQYMHDDEEQVSANDPYLNREGYPRNPLPPWFCCMPTAELRNATDTYDHMVKLDLRYWRLAHGLPVEESDDDWLVRECGGCGGSEDGPGSGEDQYFSDELLPSLPRSAGPSIGGDYRAGVNELIERFERPRFWGAQLPPTTGGWQVVVGKKELRSLKSIEKYGV